MSNLQPQQNETSICVRWRAQELQIPVNKDTTVKDLRSEIYVQTKVNPAQQKLLVQGIKPQQLVEDAKLLELPLKKGAKFMLMGTPEETIAAINAQVEAPNIRDDLEDVPEVVAQELAEQPDVKAKLQRRLDSVTFPTLNAPRQGKKCAVFDIDHTLFALGQTGERASDLARPYLHELLAGIYDSFDIVIWSATGAAAVKRKMEGLGVLGHPEYKIVCLMDYRAMVTVTTEKYGTFDCKPLAFLWSRFPNNYTEKNTVIVDDLRRNFVLNPPNGLIIRPFHGKRPHGEDSDVELAYLLGWMLHLATLEDVRTPENAKWRYQRASRAMLPRLQQMLDQRLDGSDDDDEDNYRATEPRLF